MDFTIKGRIAVKHKFCSKGEIWEKRRYAVMKACDSDIASEE